MNEENTTTTTLATFFGAIIGITLGLGVSGTVLFTSVKAVQYYWTM
jgi:hypothetical protein